MKTLLSLSVLCVLASLSCSHTRPDDMTAAEHRAQAIAHEEAAQDERAKYDPSALNRTAPRVPGSDPIVTYDYNPTESHLAAADREMKEAAEHLAAANKLETFEDAACRSIAPGARASCPLLASWVSQVRQTNNGLELVLKPEINAADANARLNCHLAYAAKEGFARPSCPLFVKGMDIKLKDNNTIAMSGNTKEVVQVLHTQAQRLFIGTPAQPQGPVSSAK